MNEKRSRIGFILIVLLTCASFIPLRSLQFRFDSEKFFPAGDPELAFFREFRNQFHTEIDDEFIFIGLKNKSGIFNRDFLKKTDSLARYVSGLENIISLYSLTTSHVLYFNNEEINARPLIHTDSISLYKTDSDYLFHSPEYRDFLISKDGKSIAIAAFNKTDLSKKQKDILLDQIQNKINELGFDESHLTAKIRVEKVYIDEIEKNLKKYLLISLAFICLSLFLLFRSVKAIILPLFVVALTIAWTLALISLTGHSLDIISSLLPPILAAICMSDITHISTHYVEKLRSGLTKKEALNKAFKEVGLATFFTCCTVAIGFMTLGITDIIPIRNFGFFAAAGLFIGFGITMVLLYAWYSDSPVPKITFEKSADHRWNSFLAGSFRTILKNKTLVFCSMILLVGVSVYFASKIEINSSLLQEVPKNNPMLKDYRFMENDFSGTRPFEMALTLDDDTSTFFQPGKMKQAEEVEQFLKDSCGVGYLISPLSLFRGANKAFNGGENDHYQLPETQAEVNRYYEGILQTEYADELEHYMSPDGRRIRISGRLPNLSLKEFKPLHKKIDDFFDTRKKDYHFSQQITGSAVLLDKMTYSLTGNLFTGVLIDALIICIIAFFLTRYRIAMLIVLIPNLVPLVAMAGAMGMMGINLKSDTSVIFAIALGIAVDDTIHFLSRLRLELDKGRSLPYAVKRTYLSTGKAIVITTLVLLSGFMTLLSSSFGGTFYIGLLISICLFFAMILELTVTPLLILLLLKKKK